MILFDRYLLWLEELTGDTESAETAFSMSIMFALVFFVMAIGFYVLVFQHGLPMASSAGLVLSAGSLSLSLMALGCGVAR